jgi:hypothetical protein
MPSPKSKPDRTSLDVPTIKRAARSESIRVLKQLTDDVGSLRECIERAVDMGNFQLRVLKAAVLVMTVLHIVHFVRAC